MLKIRHAKIMSHYLNVDTNWAGQSSNILMSLSVRMLSSLYGKVSHHIGIFLFLLYLAIKWDFNKRIIFPLFGIPLVFIIFCTIAFDVVPSHYITATKFYQSSFYSLDCFFLSTSFRVNSLYMRIYFYLAFIIKCQYC